MTNPNKNPRQDSLFSDQETDVIKAEVHRPADTDEETEAANFGLTSAQYQRYKSLYETGQASSIGAWMMVTGKSEEDYYRQVDGYDTPVNAQVEEERMTPEQIVALRPPFMVGYQPPTNNHRYPPVPPVVDGDELLRQLKEEFSDKKPEE
jgi:hypothetical protein